MSTISKRVVDYLDGLSDTDEEAKMVSKRSERNRRRYRSHLRQAAKNVKRDVRRTYLLTLEREVEKDGDDSLEGQALL